MLTHLLKRLIRDIFVISLLISKCTGELGVKSSSLCPLFQIFASSGKDWDEMMCKLMEKGPGAM